MITTPLKQDSLSPLKKDSIFSRLFLLVVLIFVFAAGYRIGDSKTLLGLNIPGFSTKTFESTLPASGTQSKLSINDRNIDFSLFWDVWDRLETKYVDRTKLSTNKLFYGALKGLVASADDPYTFFLTPEENKQSQDSLGGRFEGIGAQLGTKDGKIVVIAPLPNSPALAAGIKAGDEIVSVDGVSIKGEVVTQVVTRIRGTAGTPVTLKVARGKDEIDIKIVRAKITVNIFETTYENQIAHIKMSQFGDNTLVEWDKISQELAKKYAAGTIKGLVLDLRDNPGGYLDAAVKIASDFLPYGELVVKQESLEAKIDYRVTKNGLLPKIPVVVLINKGSASASEILAGSLRDHQRAKLVGEKSFGKGSVQEVLDLSGGAAMHVTVAKWVLPGGDWINGKGILPDFEVVNAAVDSQNTIDASKLDAQLNKADDLLK
ncbi:MAG: S41 family peptidase [Candidatus Roizmanbacteria bacterium]